MRILLYGKPEEQDHIKELLSEDKHLAYRKKEFVIHENYDDYIAELLNGFDLIVVFERGAKGMECVIAAKNVNAKTPVVWFSDDKDFAFQSYRLGVAYFGVHPVTATHVFNAMKRLYA